MLRELGCADAAARLPRELGARSAEERIRESGLAELVGWADRPPVELTCALTDAADGALAAFAALAERCPAPTSAGGAERLTERARLLGLTRRGRVSAGGACRLLEARDGWLAVNLPRPDDARSLAAWLEDERFASQSAVDLLTWERVAARLPERRAAEWAERAAWLGLAVAEAARPALASPPWLRVAARGPRRAAPPRPPLVVDLSSLWAGPLAGSLLAEAGARVIKLESARRPDGARFGSPAFFARLNGAKEQLQLDFTSADGRARLLALLASADVVIEGSRARALVQLGIDAAAWVADRPGRVWLSITGYGRDDDRVAFGDDAAAAAGLCWCVAADAPLFVGDAIADPLSGLHAAAAALAFWRRGEGALLDVALARVVGHAIAAVDRSSPLASS
jgi:crotonobetainyl-CoA:carnitine CoA-transferase CaiB-like acyl-CoA transferase